MDLAADGATGAVERGAALSSTGLLRIESMAMLVPVFAVRDSNPTTAVRLDLRETERIAGLPAPANQAEAASFIIFTIVSSTSCATPSSCGVWNIARRVVGFKVARIVLPLSS